MQEDDARDVDAIGIGNGEVVGDMGKNVGVRAISVVEARRIEEVDGVDIVRVQEGDNGEIGRA